MTAPLDPNSPRGRQIADQLGDLLARVELAIEERRAKAAQPEQASAA